MRAKLRTVTKSDTYPQPRFYDKYKGDKDNKSKSMGYDEAGIA